MHTMADNPPRISVDLEMPLTLSERWHYKAEIRSVLMTKVIRRGF